MNHRLIGRAVACLLFAICLITANADVIQPQNPELPTVDTNSAAFQDRVAWLAKLTGITPKLVTFPYAGTNRVDYELEFACPNSAYVDALGAQHPYRAVDVNPVWTYLSPETSLTDVQRACGLPLTPAHYTPPAGPKPVKPTAPKPVITNPLGLPLPGQPGCFGVVWGDNSPGDTLYTDPSGHQYRKIATPTPFGNSLKWCRVPGH